MVNYAEQADQIATLLSERLGIRGKGLEAKLRKAGRLLPPHIRREAAVLVEAVKLQESPRLSRMIDQDAAVRSYDTVEKHLLKIDSFDRRMGLLIGFLTTNALNIIFIAALVVGVMVWRGLV